MTKRQYNIRRAQEADLPHLLALYREMSVDGEREPGLSLEVARWFFAALAANPHVEILVVEEKGQVVGTATLVILPNLAHGGAPWGVVENVVVAANRRQAGIGTALMRCVTERAQAAGCYKLSLTSDRRRRRAQRFYRGLGWRRTHYGYSLEP